MTTGTRDQSRERRTPARGGASAGTRISHSPSNEREAHGARIVSALHGETAPAPGTTTDARLAILAERFGLNELETDLLAVLWVGAFDPALRAELASREAYTGQITVRLVAGLFGHPARVRLNSESPLLGWLMVQEHPLIDGGAALAIDASIVAWLEGSEELDRGLAGRVEVWVPAVDLPTWQVDQVARRILEGWLRGMRWRVHLRSDDPMAARWCAAAIGARVNRPVLGVSPGALAGDPEGAVRLHRQAFLDGCVPCTAAVDAALQRPVGVLACPLQLVYGSAARISSPELAVQIMEVELLPPDADERRRLWCTLWPEAQAWPAQQLADLALCHEASIGDIAAVAASAPLDAAAAALRLRELTRGDLGSLVQRIDATFGWNDLIVPEPTLERLQEIAYEARERAHVWSDAAAARLFPYGRGLVALFIGPPGTGKTMAAQIIAADLGLDLLTVDLSAVVSKWVGETAQHLQHLLSSRAAHRAVLFFDEADALYAKRVDEVRDAQDRYANLDTGHLMTALENYPGIVLLASNLKANIDSAFMRRIRHVVEFPKPSAAARTRIWRDVFSALFGAAEAQRLSQGLDAVARIEATGAVIKNAALSALYATRRLQRPADARLLGDMLARELAKEGAGLSTRELETLLGDAGGST